MAKRRGNVNAPEVDVMALPLKPRVSPPPMIPTEDYRHMPHIRNGKIDTSYIFSKRRLATLPVDSDVLLELEREKRLTTQGGKAKKNDAKKGRERG